MKRSTKYKYPKFGSNCYGRHPSVYSDRMFFLHAHNDTIQFLIRPTTKSLPRYLLLHHRLRAWNALRKLFFINKFLSNFFYEHM